MKNKVPSNLNQNDYVMDETLHLSKIDPHSSWLHEVYQRIRLLEFLGFNYETWEMDNELSSSYCELYMESLASVIEAVLRATFHNKNTRYCQYQKCQYHENCPVLFKKENEAIIEHSKLSFFELIDKAKEVGILSSLSKGDLHFIRQTRNFIHLPSCGDEITKSRDKVTPNIINSSIKILKKVCEECIKWLYNPNLAINCKKRIMSDKIYI